MVVMVSEHDAVKSFRNLKNNHMKSTVTKHRIFYEKPNYFV